MRSRSGFGAARRGPPSKRRSGLPTDRTERTARVSVSGRLGMYPGHNVVARRCRLQSDAPDEYRPVRVGSPADSVGEPSARDPQADRAMMPNRNHHRVVDAVVRDSPTFDGVRTHGGRRWATISPERRQKHGRPRRQSEVGDGGTAGAAANAGQDHRQLGPGQPLAEAVRAAQDYTWHSLAQGFRPGMGQYVPHRMWRAELHTKDVSPEVANACIA